MELLFLCTANICRSPMAEAMFRQLAAEQQRDVQVSSAGFLQEGLSASEHAVEVLARRGIDLSSHRSQVVTPELLEDADLVLAMARRHVRETVIIDPSVYRRTFTLKEIVRRAEKTGPLVGFDSVEAWCDELGDERTPLQMLVDAPEDDVADPVGRPLRVFKRTAVELEELLSALMKALYGD